MQEDGGPVGGEAAGDGRDSDQGEREAACGGKGMFLTKKYCTLLAVHRRK